ncbi:MULTISPECIES: GntR family transcriptional regulator [unclassified Nocardioides]|uniref:GntR family transcriptional regulator n=1 Tax=unclassified Nocardioides TaxID=2615069 RepID=UPI002406973A|nr:MULTISPECIES: GntR family transcriptional regulator [unclassified Nocardioides]MDF9714782.1 GntR family transcriptional regulator [Nocardioides sp. ChNu-99]
MVAETQNGRETDGALGEWLADELLRRILSGEVPVGSWIRHAAVAEEFGVSRTPVREALRVLHAQGVVTITPNRGARVNGHSGRDIRELGAVRGELEGLAAELAAGLIDDDQLRRLNSAWDRYDRAVDAHQAADPEADPAGVTEAARLWAEANEDFHGVILEAAASHQLSLTIAEISRRLPRNSAFAAYAGNSRLLRQNSAEHRQIAEAINAGDAARARRAMTRHVRSSAEALARWVENQGQSRDR